jgi:phosphoglycolate phosphatase
MQTDFKLLVFDWDGTLMDSEARIVACMQAAAADLGLGVPADERVRDIIGLGLREAVTALIPEADDALVQRIADRYRLHFLNQNQTPSPLFSGAAEVLHGLYDQGYLLAVATGKGRRGLDKVLAETGFDRLFHATRCADETFSKPHPEMLLQLMDELGVTAAETLMIGDTEYDLQMANNARAWGLAVSYGVHARERLLQQGPLGCLDDIRDLGAWLEPRSAPLRALEEAA